MDIIDLLEKTVSHCYGLRPTKPLDPLLMSRSPQIISHRGQSLGQIENTLEAFTTIQKADVFGIEFDIRWTSDDVPIVLHDPTTQRVFGSKNTLEVNQISFHHLRKTYPAIPSLEEVIIQFGSSLHLMIEFKTVLTIAQQKIVRSLLKDMEPCQDYHLMAIHPQIIKSLLFTENSSLLAISLLNPREMLKFTFEQNLGGLTGHFLLLSQKLSDQLQKKGMTWGTGFADNPAIMSREITRNTPFIYSNRAVEMHKFCKEFTNGSK